MATAVDDACNEFDSQSDSDELGIDYVKTDLLKSQIDFIYETFNVSIEFDSHVKSNKTTPTKFMTQWVALYGDEKSRSSAKEFIKALCNPAFKKTVDKTNDELAFLTRDNFLNNLIKENAVYIEIDMNNNLLVIQGNPLNLTIVESLIDEKLHSCKAVLPDDSVIFISDDPYEELDMPKSRSLGNTPIKMSSGKTDEINKSLEKLNVSPARPSAAVSLTNNLLLNIGLNQGYTLEEINKAIKHFGTPKIGQTEFINYLKSNRESYLLKMRNIDFLAKKVVVPNLQSVERSLTSPSKSPTNKKKHLNDDCEIVAVLPLPTSAKNSANDAVSAIQSTKNKQILEEYAQMFQTKEPFDKDQEKANKEIRMQKLIQAMPSVEQARALRHVNEFKSKTEPTSTTSTFTVSPASSSLINRSTSSSTCNQNTIDDDDSFSKNLIWDKSMSKAIKIPPQSPRTLLLTDPSYQLASQPIYNPKLYTTFDDNANKKIMFTNFDGDNRSSISSSYNATSNPSITFANNQKADNNAQNQNVHGNRKRSKSIAEKDDQAKNVHGKKQNAFSCRGIQLVVDYFVERGHDTVEVYVPRFRRGNSDRQCPSLNPEVLDKLDREGVLKYTPSKSYDDRFIVIAASHHDGIIVSNDQFRDLQQENSEWRQTLTQRLLQFVFSDDLFIPAQDPLGKNGPKLDKFLSFPNGNPSKKTNSNLKTSTHTDNHRIPEPDSLSYPARNIDAIKKPIANKNNQHTSSTIKNLNQTRNSLIEHKGPADKPIRNVAQTTDLYNRLMAIFPDLDIKIREILNNHPNVYDIEFFSNKLFDALGW